MERNVDLTKEEEKVEKEKRQAVSKREFFLNDGVSAGSVKDIITGILEVNRYDAERERRDSDYQRQPIRLIVNTYGGSVYDGFGLVAVIDTSETPVHTYLYGKAMSMGLIIFASGHRRFAHPLGTLMYHQISVGAQDKIEGIEQVIAQSHKLNEAYDNYLLAVSNIPKKKLDQAKKQKQELYMFALEAIEYGLVDEILPSRRQR
jgi:ATP-dependent Clp protease protease subunit